MIRRSFLKLATSAAAVAPFVARAQSAPAAPRTAEDFASLPFFEDPVLSPDGARVAAKIAVKGEQFFAITPLAHGEKPAVIASGDNQINWWRWVTSDWLAVGVGAVQTVGSDDLYVTRLMGVSADGKRVVPIASRDAGQIADRVVWFARDGTPRVRLALQRSIYYEDAGFWPDVVEADLSTGRTKSVVHPEPGVLRWYADAAGTIRVGIGTAMDGRTQRLLYRPDASSNFHLVNRADTAKGEHLIVPALFLPQPGQAIAIDDRDGFDAVYKLDLTTMSLGEKLYGVPGYDIDGIVTDAAGTNLLGVSLTDEAARTHWLDADMAGVQEAIDKSVPGRRALIVSMDDARQRFLVHIRAADRPGSYYVMDSADARLVRLANVNERIGTGRASPVRTFRYKARDGLEMSAVLTLPADREAKALPVVAMPHGGPFARDSEEWDWWAQFLAARGYAVVQPNFRGSSGFGRDFAIKGEGQWGLAMQDDVDDGLKEVVRLGIGDAKRAAIVGGSYGGYAALRAAQRGGGLYRCAVSFAGVADLPAMLRYDGRFLNSGSGKDWIRRQAPDLAAVSPINFPDQFSIPVLLVHGKADQRVPVKQSREMAEKLRKAAKTVRYVEQPLGDHHLSREADRLAFLQETAAFLGQYNPA